MGSQAFEQLDRTLRAHFKDLDIRSDQCELIRIITPALFAGCSFVDGYYYAKVIALDGDFDFETTLLAELKAESINDLCNRSRVWRETIVNTEGRNVPIFQSITTELVNIKKLSCSTRPQKYRS